jgi:formylmethanofuran dehydrogenase subunit E
MVWVRTAVCDRCGEEFAEAQTREVEGPDGLSTICDECFEKAQEYLRSLEARCKKGMC